MPAVVNCSPHFAMLESRYAANQDGSPLDGEDVESPEDMKQMKLGKPPRHLSVSTHCASSARFPEFVCSCSYLFSAMRIRVVCTFGSLQAYLFCRNWILDLRI